jgi:hypothetical protein
MTVVPPAARVPRRECQSDVNKPLRAGKTPVVTDRPK